LVVKKTPFFDKKTLISGRKTREKMTYMLSSDYPEKVSAAVALDLESILSKHFGQAKIYG
jgi:hypothetical protein